MFTQKFGAEWNAARECDIERAKNPWTEIELWVEKKWMTDGLHYIDEQKWIDWVVNAPEGSKPWLIDFGFTPLSGPQSDSLFNSRIARAGCIAKHLGHLYNVGFGDYRKAENILESFDFVWGQFGMMAPLQTVIKDGTLYQFEQNNMHLIYYAEYLAVVSDENRKNVAYTSPVLAPRNELNIYWEYAKRDLGRMRIAGKTDR
jgi:hypothetical protein